MKSALSCRWLSFGMTVPLLFVIASSCSKGTKGSSDAPKATSANTLVDPSASAKASADATGSLPDVNAAVDGIDRQARELDENLSKALEAEAQARKTEDDKMTLKLGDIEKRIDDLAAKMATEIARLDEQDRKLASDLKEQTVAYKAVNETLRVDFDKRVSDLAASIRQQFADDKSANDEARNKLRAELEGKIAKLADDLSSYHKFADENFATKADLAAALLVVQNLQNVMEILGKKLDDNDATINARVSKEVKDLKTEISNNISLVKADVESVRGLLFMSIEQFLIKVKETGELMSKDATDLKKTLATVQSGNEQSMKNMNAKLDAFTNRVAGAEYYAQDVRKELLAKVAELQARDAELSDEVRKARNEAAKKLSDAIAVEQAERAKMSAKVDELFKETQRIAAVASQGLKLAQANELATKGLRSDLEAAKKDFATQLDAFRNDMNDKMNAIAEVSRNIVVDLGKEVQRQFVETTTGIADLKNRDVGLGNEIARMIADKVESATLENFKTTSKPAQDKLTAQTAALKAAFAAVETEFMFAFDYVNGKAGVDTKALNETFIPIAAFEVCNGITGTKVGEGIRNATVANREWFFHLARVYSIQLISGMRSGDADLDKIFHGTTPNLDGKSLYSAIVLTAIPSRAAGTSGGCVTKVEDWAKGILAGDNDLSKALREAVSKSQGLRNAISTMLKPSLLNLRDPADSFQKSIAALVKPKLASDDAVARFLETEPAPGLNSQMAKVFDERAGVQSMLAAHLQNSDNILQVAKDVAEAKDKQAATDGAKPIASIMANLQEQINQLNKKLDDAIASIPTEKVNKLTDSLKVSLNLIAGIASRLGYADIVELARSEVTKVGGDLDKRLLFPIGCKATSHFFNYAAEGDPLKRCDTGIDLGNGGVGDNGRCRSVTHENTTTNSSITTYRTDSYAVNYGVVSWVNTRCWAAWCSRGPDWYYLGTSYAGSNYQQFVSSISNTDVRVQWGMVGALRAPIISPLLEEAQKLMARKEGEPFPTDRKTMIGLRIFGNAWKWRLTDMKNQSIDLDAEQFRVKDVAAGLIYEIPASMLLSNAEGQTGMTETARVIALDSLGKPSGADCLHNMNGGTIKTQTNNIVSNVTYVNNSYYQATYWWGVNYYTSPIVLDLSGSGKVETISARDSNAQFDLGSSGITRRVGWIKPNAGFLVLDVNGDGKINNGREMFGTATLLPDGREARNGYEALAQYDTGAKGYIDLSDKIFSKLRLWIDANGDGISQRRELKTLAELGISRVGSAAGEVPLQDQTQFANGPSKNLLLYQGKYWGSKCPADGCKSYDIYFGVDRSIGVASVKSSR